MQKSGGHLWLSLLDIYPWVACATMWHELGGMMTSGLRKGLTSYGDAGFSLFLRKAFIKAMNLFRRRAGAPDRRHHQHL